LIIEKMEKKDCEERERDLSAFTRSKEGGERRK